jgi:murein DD-endopeptidase MepM/ murein hydrolase activator NlpD
MEAGRLKYLEEQIKDCKMLANNLQHLYNQESKKEPVQKYIWPCIANISCYFGKRKAPTAGASTEHKGIDIAASLGTPIKAVAKGKVIFAGAAKSAGNETIIDHGGGVKTFYMHQQKILIHSGDEVEQGDVIGTVGSTGVSTGPHLHFGLMLNGVFVNPLYDYLPRL